MATPPRRCGPVWLPCQFCRRV